MSPQTTATVRRIWSETSHLQGVILEVAPELAGSFQHAGQVLTLHPNDTDKVYLALAGAPGEAESFELLLGSSAQTKLALREGTQIQISPPQGRGFPLDMAKGHDVLLFAVGSALAPIRSVLSVLRKQREAYGRIRLYVGAHTPADFPYRGEFAMWKAEGVEITESISKPWVQDRFLADPPPLDNAVAYLAGMKGMMDAVSAALAQRGLPDSRIGRNW